jgi:hypothetical protein
MSGKLIEAGRTRFSRIEGRPNISMTKSNWLCPPPKPPCTKKRSVEIAPATIGARVSIRVK